MILAGGYMRSCSSVSLSSETKQRLLESITDLNLD